MSKPTVFLREATGLVRDFTATDALLLAIGSIIGPTWVPVFAGEWISFPGVNIPLSLILIGLFAVFNGFYYVLITAVMPRSGGGGYVPISRMIHPALGMGMSFILVTAFILNIGFIGNITTSVGVAGPLTTYAILTGNTGLQNFASSLSTPIMAFIAGLITIALVTLVAISGTRTVRIVNRAAIIIGTVGMLLVVAILLGTTQPQFQSAFEKFTQAGAYSNTIALAEKLGYSTPSNWVTPTLLSLPLSYFAILGYAFNTYYSGEVRRVPRSMSLAVVFSIVYAVGFFAIIAVLAQNSFGTQFITHVSYLGTTGNYTQIVSSGVPPYVNTFVAMVNTSPIINALLIMSYIAWGYFLIINFLIMSSRHFLAWSFDRAVPSRFGSVSERFHTPVTAILTASGFGVVTLIAYTFLPAVFGSVTFSVLYPAALVVDGLAGAVLVLKRKDLLNSAPSIAQKKVGGIALIAILGIYTVIFNAFLVVEATFTPAISGPLQTIGVPTFGTVLGAFILGVVIYYAMKSYHARRGVDIIIAFKELPPE